MLLFTDNYKYVSVCVDNPQIVSRKLLELMSLAWLQDKRSICINHFHLYVIAVINWKLKNVKYLTAASKKIEIYRHTPKKVWLRFVYWNL